MRLGFVLAIAALAIGLSGPVLAQVPRAPGVQPLDRILPEVRRSNPGEFYDADGPTQGPGGSEHYHLKWMRPDGRIEWLDTDARTGRVLGRSPGRDAFDGPGARREFAPAPSMPPPPQPGQFERGRFGGGYGPPPEGGYRERGGFGGRGDGRGDFGGRGRGGFGGGGGWRHGR
jgi:hypothetical protein